jgi:protein gp37
MARRLAANPVIDERERTAYAGGRPILRFEELLGWMLRERPAVIAVQLMGDLFAEVVSPDVVYAVLRYAVLAKQHTFVLLTRRPRRAAELLEHPPNIEVPWWPAPNVAVGTSCSSQDEADRLIPDLLRIPARWRFVSLEPLLGPVMLGVGDPRATGEPFGEFLDGVIVGGETGPDARAMDPDWVRRVRDDCAAAGVPFYFKHWGDRLHPAALEERGGMINAVYSHKHGGDLLDGRLHKELPWEMPR